MKKYALLFLIVIAFTSGGYGGPSGDLQGISPPEDSTHTVSAPLDSDGDGVPDVFRYYGAGYSDGRSAPDDGRAYDVPYLNYIDSSDTEEDGSFSANIYLSQGSEYVMKYSHSSRPLGENDIEFTILTPDEKIIEFDFGFHSDAYESPSESRQEEAEILSSSDAEAAQPEEQPAESDDTQPEYISVSASIDILPPENPCIIFYTFTAPQTGIYAFTVREKQYSPASHDVPYELRIYRSDDDSALKLGSITMTPREMLHVQRMLVSYASEFNRDGLPVAFKPELVSDNAYQNVIQSISEDSAFRASLRAAADTGTSMKPVVYDVPYDDEFEAGRGFYADSGLAARSDNAFYIFDMPTPQKGTAIPVDTLFKMREIITEEDHTWEQELNAMNTFALGKNALGMRKATATNVRLAQISKTIIITYDVIERQPRRVDVSNVELIPDALDILKADYREFRREFGDYFVAGYTWGLRFKAVISVTADNSSVMDKVCATIQTIGSIAQAGGNYASDIAYLEMVEKSSYLDIAVDELIIDGGDPRKNELSSVSAVQSFADALAGFARQIPNTTKNDYVKLKVCLERFREIPAAKSLIPELLPVPADHFNAILEMNREIFRTHFYYNALMSIPPTKLFNGSAKHDEWRNEYQTLLDSTKLKISYICEDKKRVDDCCSQFRKLHTKYQGLCERYVFYQRLIEAQSKQPRGFWDSDADRDKNISAEA